MSEVAPILDVEGLTVDFAPPVGVRAPWTRAVDGVGFSLARGEVLAVVGESGCGKSAMALAILGLHPRRTVRVAARRLTFEGRALLSLSPRARRALAGAGMGMVFQDPPTALTPWLRVGDQLAETFRFHRGLSRAEGQAAAEALLARVGVPDPARRMDAWPHELSGGTQQRVLLAIALAGGPRVLLADEPTTALDATVQAEILVLLRALAAEDGLAVVLVTHDLGVVAAAADRALVLYAGRVAEEASVDDLFARPAHPYTRALLAAAVRPDRAGARPAPIPGRPPRPEERPAGCAFAPRCPLAAARCAALPPAVACGAGHAAACWAVEEVRP